MISQQTVQAIHEAARIEEVVEDFVKLKRAGSNLKGLCPFHQEKTPSFVVSPAKNLFKCFGCGKGGSPISFVMEHESMSYPEALRYLAAKYKIEIEETGDPETNRQEKMLRDSLFIINDYARKYYHEQLTQTDRGKSVGLSYFKDRGFTDATIQQFGLGYAPAGGKDFREQALKEGYELEFLEKLGLVSARGFDFFRDRVMFPIHNQSGKVVAFAGRILQSTKKAPKYINSPETEIYHKSKVLYGLFQARKSIRKKDEAIFVEGYTDVISLHQAGVENVVATSGTSLTEGQIGLVKRLTPNVLLLFDGDPAGLKAALRGVDMLLAQDVNVRVVALPEGEDPDSYVQKVGKEAFLTFLEENARDFILFKTDLLLRETKGDPVKKAALVTDVVESISKIPDPIKRSVYVKECAGLLDMDEQALIDVTNKLVARQIQDRRRRQDREEALAPSAGQEAEMVEKRKPARSSTSSMEMQEREIARILVVFGEAVFDEENQITVAEHVLASIEEVMDDFDHLLYGRIARESLRLLQQGQPVSRDYFVHHEDAGVRELAVEFLQSPYEYSNNWEDRWDIILQTQKMPEDNFEKDSENVLLRFKYEKIKKMFEENSRYIQELEQSGDLEKMQERLMVHMELKKMSDPLARRLGIVVIR